ncbi:hypothetical protein PO909_000884 [Leuciscus waleckii]
MNPFHRLHLEGRHHNKLRATDILRLTSAHSLQSHESCAEEELIQTFIQKLLMMNYRARYIKTNETNEESNNEQGSYDSLRQDSEDFFSNVLSVSNEEICKSERIHPMDVQMAAFHCADGFLKQLMVTKLSPCQYALPLLVPDPDTQQIEFPLWTFRQINKSWKMKNTNNETISQTHPIYKAQTPMVFFFRFGSVSSSKSQLMNSLINEKHNTFFHRNCPGSSRTRVLMDGVVEIAWFCPSGSDDDKFTDCVAFCNLHGDAGDHEKQLQILSEMSSVNVVQLSQVDKNDKSMIKLDQLYKDSKPLICLFTEDEYTLKKMKKGKFKIGLKDRNQSDVSEELRRIINDCLSESSSTFRLEDVSKHSDIRVDEEDDDDCRRGRAAAQQMMSLLEKKDLTEIKESFLPHQGKEMNTDTGDKIYFIKWLGILLDEYISADLSDLHHKCNEKWSMVLKMKENYDEPEKLTAEQAELERISEKRQAAAFGVEHIMREVGQIYESCSSVNKNKKDLQFDFSSLPSLAAEMMISGFPLELMDGDAAHVPVIWISAVLDELIQKLGDQRVFVLSVLGIQSSGKSTMLNAMFGLQFAVSAGRCTRGAFMQMVRLSDEMKTQINFDYILVVDTEGLRALELAGRSTRHHDNELATFVVGLANLTLINIFGENPSEMQDILQIVVQAFLRMKKVRLNPRCVFVHQNVSDVTAGEKNMEGRRRLLQTLDEMTKLAAEEEDYDAECFSDVIDFDVQNDVKYFAQLWEGSPPMAPPNPKYCENIQELKKTIMSHTSKSHGIMQIDLKDRIKDLWEALLKERFVFRKLETEYSKWSWSLRSAMMETENKLHIQSKELPLKLKDKVNDEETLKKEFELFWEQSVNRIVSDTSPIRDIDIMRDVRDILSDIYESAPVDHIKENSEFTKIFTVSSYCEYIHFKKSTKKTVREVVKGAYRKVQKTFGYSRTLSPKKEAEIKSLITDVEQQTEKMIQLFNISKMGYNISCIQKITGYIKNRVTEHQKGVKYEFKKEFFIDLVLSIFKRANKMITDQHRLFKEANDPAIYVEKKRDEYYSIFQKYCHIATPAPIFGEIICQKLKEPIEQSVYKKTARYLAGEMKTNCESLNGNRSKLEKHILKTLAEEEDFDKYMNYINYPRDHFKSFIRDEVSRYITDKFSVTDFKMKKNIKLLQQKIMKAAHKSTQYVQENRGDVGLWLKRFTRELSGVLIFSEKDLSGVKHDDVDDLKLLEDVIRDKLPAIISDIISRFNTKTFPVKLDSKFRPDELLIEHFSQCCWVQCPFCKTVCTNSIENHHGDHSVAFHRSIGLNGICYHNTSNLSTHICTSAVANRTHPNEDFHPNASDYKVLCREYRRAGEDYANWSITPDLSELPYWKWFVCRFQKDLEKYHKKTFEGEGEIPDEWRKYSKQEVIESLDKYM